MDVHQAARRGFTEGGLYEQYRPSFTDELARHVVTSFNLGTPTGTDCQYDVLELGAGTGKFTRALAQQLPQGTRFLATEPMEAFLETLQKSSPDIETRQCTARDIPLPDSSVKNVVCAQSFHWFADDVSLDEIRRVLIPSGRLIFVWNVRDVEKWGWLKEMETILDEFYVDVPRFLSMAWKSVVENHPGFQLVESSRLPGIEDLKGSKSLILQHYASISVIVALDEDRKRAVRSRLKAVIDKQFPTDDDSFLPHLSQFYCVQKK